MNKVWFHRNWLRIQWVALSGILAYLYWELGIAIAIAVLSIFIVTFFSSRTLRLTQNSLDLTRATTRPFLTIEAAGIILPETLVRLVVKNTGALPAENGKFKLTIIPIQETDKVEFIIEDEIPLLFPNNEMSLFSPHEQKTPLDLKAASDFIKLIDSGKEIHFKLAMEYRYKDLEYAFGETFRLLPRPKVGERILTLLYINGTSFYK